MITRVEAYNYRCLKDVSVPLGPFHILVGPNGSGKSTFLDVIAFLQTFVTDGLEAAFEERTRNPVDLSWARSPAGIQLSVEAQRRDDAKTMRYSIKIGGVSAEAPQILEEVLKFTTGGDRPIILRSYSGNTGFVPEEGPQLQGKSDYLFAKTLSAFGNLPDDRSRFPDALWLRDLLQNGVRPFALESAELRKASRREKGKILRWDGSGLPWLIRDLQESHPGVFQNWLAHVRMAIPTLEDIRVSLREDEGTAFLVLRYSDGLEAPSWVVSDGTLQLIALTALGYVPWFSGIYLIEEPENGIHPMNMQEIYDSLSSVYDGQVLVASHSPVFLSIAQKKELLCFMKDKEGATEIVPGDKLPALEDWRGEVDLGSLFATGILGQ